MYGGTEALRHFSDDEPTHLMFVLVCEKLVNLLNNNYSPFESNFVIVLNRMNKKLFIFELFGFCCIFRIALTTKTTKND